MQLITNLNKLDDTYQFDKTANKHLKFYLPARPRDPLGGDEGSRGDVPCVRRIARNKETSRKVQCTRLCYIETI